MMKTLQACTPRPAVLDDTADFVVNLADLPQLTEEEAKEFLDSNVLTSGMEFLLMQAFSRLAGIGSASGIYKLSEAMGGGKTQSMIVAGILARFPHLASMLPFQNPLPAAIPDVVVSFTERATDKKVWVSLGAALGANFSPDRAPSEDEWRDLLKAKRIPFYNMRYDKGVEHRLLQTLSGRIQEITTIFGTVPDFIVDRWVEDMLQDKEWDSTAEVLNQIGAFQELLYGW
jgi:hypothetical protein